MPDDEVLTLARARIGKILRGKYRLDRILGIGGMAVVYAATHRNKKRFAIKMLHPELSVRENIRTRFLREGYVANTVEHAGAVAVLDDDIAEDGSAFVVMELLEGAPIDEVWARHGRRVPLALVLSIGDSLLDVLAAAHVKGIVHRDIKPANLFLTNDGRLEVLDFGIARLHDDTSTSATQTGAMLGTPAYMAPEQALAEASKVDGQTDLWAVGATLFSLLTGELVHAGENASQLLVNAATKKAREISSVSEEVPKKVASVIDKALAFEKKDRWANAREMREALAKACLEVTGAPIAPLPKTEKVTGLEETIAPEMASGAGSSGAGFGSGSGSSGAAFGSGSGGASSGAAFDPTVNAISESKAAPASAPMPPQTTGAAVSRSQNAPPLAAARAMPWRKIAFGALACAAIAGGVGAVRAARAPKVRYCLEKQDTRDGFGCYFEVKPDVLGRRFAPVNRVTETSGHVVKTESVNFAGRVDDRDSEFAWEELVRDDKSDAVRERVGYDRLGTKARWEKWSEGGKRIDEVDLDGITPRHHSSSVRFTTSRVEYDAEGRPTRVLFFGPTGRPRPDESGTYGAQYEYGKTPGVATKVTSLGSDGTPAAGSDGVAVQRRTDDGSPWGDRSFFDIDGRPVAQGGFQTLHILHDDVEQTGVSLFGPGGEPASTLRQAVHEVHDLWNPEKRTYEQRVFGEQGRPQVVRGLWVIAVRDTFDERGRRVLFEGLDEQGNRVISTDGLAAERFSYDDHDLPILVEDLDPSGALIQGRTAFARREAKYDAHGNVLEYRYYDEAGHLAPWKEGGAIRRSTYDDRDLKLTTSNFDAEGRPVSNVHGFSAEHAKYDRLRNLVEEAYVGPDGKPVASDEGFAVRRHTYDENDDLVAVAYFDANGAPTPFASSYATERFKNDERGLVVEEAYFDVHGDPVVIKDGYASVKRTRDRNGDVIAEAYFGKHGEPIAREGGFASRKFAFDIARRPVEVSLFDTTGQAVRGSMGWAVERTKYDARGLVLRIDHFDAAKAPALDRDGRASVTKVWDSRANLKEETSLDAAGNPVASTDGYATKKTAYDERDEVVEEALFGADGKPVSGKASWSLRRVRYDDFGNVVEESFFDGAHEPIVPKGLPYSSMKQRFDARHRLVESSYFDLRGAPAKGPDGAAVVRYKRDGYGRAIETSYFDGSGEPSPSEAGRIVVRAKYDDAGRLIDERFVDASGAPRTASDGCAGHHTKLDPLGHKLEESCLDAKDAPTLSADGWALRRTLHDARGNDVEVTTYGPDGTLRADKAGIARRQNRFDERNLLLETMLFDAKGKPAHDQRGMCSTRFVYDDAGKKMAETAYDANGRELVTPKH
jgi:serine/threonine protein kinase